MTRNTLYLFALAATALSLSAPTSYASGLDDNKVLRDSNGHIVRSVAFGTCVRSKWEAGSNPCAPVPTVAQTEPAPAPKTYERTTVATADRTIYFDFDSAQVSPQAQTKLDSLAHTLSQANDIKSATIVGYADRKGSSSYNRQLSKRRAENVKTYLAQQGYVKTQVADVRAAGETSPMAQCDPTMPRSQEIECLSPDRRVELEIQYLNTQHYSQAN